MAIVAGTDTCNNGSVVTGTLTATGLGNSLRALPLATVSVTIYGTFVGTVAIQRSFDGGTTFVPVYVGTTALSYTAPASTDLVGISPEVGVLYAVNCTAYTSGTISYRLSH